MKLLHEYVALLIESNSEPDITQYVDALENKIFEFLFTKSTYDYLQTLEDKDEVTTVLKTNIFDDFNNINEIHIGISVNNQGAGEVSAAYVCIPNEREKSNLVLTLNIPRDYPKISGFQDWLSAELADSLSHEIQHSCDTSDILTGDGNIPEGDDKWGDLESIERYYASEAETRGHIAGILGRSRRTGEEPGSLLKRDIETIMFKAVSRGYNKAELVPVVQNIYNKWLERLNNVKDNRQ
jgi:hypothetical protein